MGPGARRGHLERDAEGARRVERLFDRAIEQGWGTNTILS